MKNKLFQLRTTNYELRTNSGSALILAVVLVSLLAVVSVMFAMVARIDKMSTSAIAENKTLNLAVDTVIAEISRELASDVPGPNQEYYDYPDADNAWLASLEPYESGGNYYWRRISDVTGFLGYRGFQIDNVNVDPPGPRRYIDDYSEITLDASGGLEEQSADADGDGIADSKWFELDDITSSKGKPIYAAVRIVDNGGMLNVNTGYKFDPADPNLADGSNQMQIDLLTLAKRGSTPNPESRLNNARYGSESQVLSNYIKDVIWQYNVPDGNYTPFDISDELEVRNRFFINYPDIDTRIEEMWDNAFQVGRRTPFDSNFSDWCEQAIYIDTNEYDYRHIATTYNMDRIINPVGGKMVNINGVLDVNDANELYTALVDSVTGGATAEVRGQFAQLAANIVDFADDDIEVTVFKPGDPAIRPAYYGFDAQPFITEIGFIIDSVPQSGRNYYAVELYNPFSVDISLENNFELVLMDIGSGDPCIPIPFDSGEVIAAGGYLVIANDPGQFVIDTDNVKSGPQLNLFGTWEDPSRRKPPGGDGGRRAPPGQPDIGWSNNYKLFLMRRVGDPADPNWIYVDRQQIDPSLAVAGEGRYFGRDMRDWRVIYQTPDFVGQCLIEETVGSLGRFNNTIESTELLFSFFLPNPLATVQKFITVGDIPRVLTIGHSTNPSGTIGQLLWETQQLEVVVTGQDQEHLVRLDLQNPDYRNIFQYLTVFDPSRDGIDNDGDGLGDEIDPNLTPEFKIPGRININTAPWYVIAQLPWVSAHTLNYELARTIIAYRDKTIGPSGDDYSARVGQIGFGSIGELNYVVDSNMYCSIDYYVLDGDDSNFPDLTPADGIIDDFEERDVIFSRISNLVTVRSDVFTAYILVRIGTDGPQKRVIAILDRSDVYPNLSGEYTGRVKARALHPVPDPR